MSKQPSADVPEFDLADRMRKALRHSRTGAGEMAAWLGVDRSSVSNWLSGRVEPSTQTLRLWAIRCGVDYLWLAGPEVALAVRYRRLAGVRRPGGCPRIPSRLRLAALACL